MMTQPSELYEVLSKKHDIPIEQIREAVVFFWRTGVKRNLEAVINRELYINKLGSFKIKGYKLKYVIPSVVSLSLNPDAHERTIEYFTHLRDRLIKIEADLKEIKEKNKEFHELNKKNSRDIQKSTPDMGGA